MPRWTTTELLDASGYFSTTEGSHLMVLLLRGERAKKGGVSKQLQSGSEP